MSPTLIEDDLRAALRAAADDVHPRARSLPPSSNSRRPTAPGARRWLIPAVAAAAVVGITVPVLAVMALRGPAGPDIAAASAVTTSAGRATVAGISFPLPSGWSAKTVTHTDTSVTVCVAAKPSATCDGVTLRIAVPNATGAITPVPDPLSTDESSHRSAPPGPYGSTGAGPLASDPVAGTTPTNPGGSRAASAGPASELATPGPGVGPLVGASAVSSSAGAPDAAGSTLGTPDTAGTAVPVPLAAKPDLATETCPLIADRDPIDERPAVHYSIGSCAPGSPQSADWYILDGSLAVSTPRGVANQQASHLVAGMDLSGYHHAFGPQIAFFSGPGEASSSTVPTR